MHALRTAVLQTLRDPRDRRVLLLVSVVLFVLLIVTPVFAIPSNTLDYQLHSFSIQNYVLMLVLSLLAGLTFSLEWRAIREIKKSRAVSAGGLLSSIVGVASAALSTVYCGCGIAFFIGFAGLGTGGTLFFIQHQTYFLIGGMVLMLVTLYFAARRVAGVCAIA